MRLLISGEKALTQPIDNGLGWKSLINEPYTGAWQRNDELKNTDIRAFFAIYSCTTLISGDVSKLKPRLMALDSHGIQVERPKPSVLKRPNRYQNWIQFAQWWMTSKLASGNTYALKERDARGGVVALYILDPCRVQVLVSDDGGVYYELSQDQLNGVEQASVTVPASEIIHDRYQPQYHPLIGITPIFAAALSGKLGLRIQQDSQTFFANGAKPGGILTAPGAISDETANRLQAYWNANFTGANAGRVAVVGDGLKFEAMRVTSVDAQLVEQLKLAADVVCSCFHVPSFKIGAGTLPSTGKVEDMNLIYYTDCLQVLIEELELCLADGLGVSDRESIELDINSLWRMDSESQYRTLAEGLKGIMAPNEARKKVNLPPVDGGDSVYMQQQNYSLEALAKRDAQEDPFSTGSQPAIEPEPAPEQDADDTAKMLAALVLKELSIGN